jgi:hypothetical protein
MSVNIAVVDSGINAFHSHVQGIEGGISFEENHENKIVPTLNFYDNVGHGTAIAGILRHKSPFANIFAIKIFYKKLFATPALLIAALEWLIEQDMNIIHLSLGTKSERAKNRLYDICNKAYKKNIVVVASARFPADSVYPSVFDEVIGVYWNKQCSEDSIVYHPGNPIEFGTYGKPRPLPGKSQILNFQGHSFAAAYVSSYVAQIIKYEKIVDTLDIKQLLSKRGQKNHYE